MKIGITSQNFRTVTGHAGKSRRFLIYEDDGTGKAVETGRLDLPREMSMHEFRGIEHPIGQLDVLITGSCGEGFIRRLAQWNVTVMPTAETDPQKAAQTVLDGGALPPPEPHEHH